MFEWVEDSFFPKYRCPCGTTFRSRQRFIKHVGSVKTPELFRKEITRIAEFRRWGGRQNEHPPKEVKVLLVTKDYSSSWVSTACEPLPLYIKIPVLNRSGEELSARVFRRDDSRSSAIPVYQESAPEDPPEIPIRIEVSARSTEKDLPARISRGLRAEGLVVEAIAWRRNDHPDRS